MGCCCIKTLNLCNVGVCGVMELDQLVESGASGLYTLLLDFLDTAALIEQEQVAGQKLQFDLGNLNESYQYTGQIFDYNGNPVSILVGGESYDCIKFKTITRIRVEATTPPPVLVIPNTVVIEDEIGQPYVITGSTDIVEGLDADSVTITCDAFAGVRVIVIRGSVPIPGIPTTDGSNYFTKVLANNYITLSAPLAPGEFIRIQTIPE